MEHEPTVLDLRCEQERVQRQHTCYGTTYVNGRGWLILWVCTVCYALRIYGSSAARDVTLPERLVGASNELPASKMVSADERVFLLTRRDLGLPELETEP